MRVSGLDAQLTSTKGGWTVNDLNSRYGTFVNERQVTSQHEALIVKLMVERFPESLQRRFAHAKSVGISIKLFSHAI